MDSVNGEDGKNYTQMTAEVERLAYQVLECVDDIRERHGVNPRNIALAFSGAFISLCHAIAEKEENTETFDKDLANVIRMCDEYRKEKI